MEIVYASLHRRSTTDPVPPNEVGEVLGILWAHARPEENLEHVSARSERDRLDLLLYLLTPRPGAATPPPVAAAHSLLVRSHQASPVLRRRFQAPTPDPVPTEH
ncbi:hypothetical protein [Kitasatospora sp. NPDC048407]|uniref:hypothetical protein n=1 Tax=Kitasatospora sp. NPDC048407 TaxID=3364051 RepID=UPI00371905EF